jgi:hypothetical protein
MGTEVLQEIWQCLHCAVVGEDPESILDKKIILTLLDTIEQKQAKEGQSRLLRSVQQKKYLLFALINSIDDEIWFCRHQSKNIYSSIPLVSTSSASTPIEISSWNNLPKIRKFIDQMAVFAQ